LVKSKILEAEIDILDHTIGKKVLWQRQKTIRLQEQQVAEVKNVDVDLFEISKL
jgi:hypothetical protein